MRLFKSKLDKLTEELVKTEDYFSDAIYSFEKDRLTTSISYTNKSRVIYLKCRYKKAVIELNTRYYAEEIYFKKYKLIIVNLKF